MSRSLSTAMVNALNARETSDVFLILLTLTHENLAVPIRVVNNNEDIISNGDTFVAYPFDLVLPDDRQDSTPQGKLIIDNVDRILIETIRSITSSVSIKIQIIRADDPDDIEMTLENLDLRNVSANALTVEGDIVISQFLTEGFPSGRFSPSNFPGIF